MYLDESSSSELSEPRHKYNALRLGDGQEYAEFDPELCRLTIYHVLGVRRQASLGHAEAYLLDYLVMNAGKTISRQELLDHAWSDRVVSQGSLNQAISALRGILGDDQKREVILTIPRLGYQFSTQALMSWQEWLVRKQELWSSDQVEEESEKILLVESSNAVSSDRNWHGSVVWWLSGILFFLLLTKVCTSYFYIIFPPYASVRFDTSNSHITLIAKDQKELDETRKMAQSILEKMDALGGVTVLVNRNNNNLEFNCLRPDGTLHTLFVNIDRVGFLMTKHLLRCLR